MHALLVYGSLIHPDELSRHRLHDHAATPVRVHGFRRSFCQEPSWRQGTGRERGVLTVHPTRGEWFNALLVPDLDADVLSGLDDRERGYSRVRVPADRLEPYRDTTLGTHEEVHLYTGREERYSERILPHEEYLDLCVEGARHWGADFLRDFLASTYVQAETPLADHSPHLAPPVPA